MDENQENMESGKPRNDYLKEAIINYFKNSQEIKKDARRSMEAMIRVVSM